MKKIFSILFTFLFVVGMVTAAAWEKDRNNGFTWYYTQEVDAATNYYPNIPIPEGASHTMVYVTAALYPYSSDSTVDVDVTAYLATPIGASSVEAQRWTSSSGVVVINGGVTGDSTSATKLIKADYTADSILVGSIRTAFARKVGIDIGNRVMTNVQGNDVTTFALLDTSVLDTGTTEGTTTTVSANDVYTTVTADDTMRYSGTERQTVYANIAPVYSHVRILCDGQAANKYDSKVYLTVRFIPINEFKLE